MIIDTSFFKNDSVVIWCRTKSEAELLLEGASPVHSRIREQLDYKVKNFDREADSEGLGYRLDRRQNGFDIGYGNMYYYRSMGYKIIEFKDIVMVKDLGDIDSGFISSSKALEALF